MSAAAAAHRAGDEPLTRAAVLGAGTMGRGIAQLLLQAGLEVTLVDPAAAARREARDSLEALFASLHAKGRVENTPAELLAKLAFAGEIEATVDAQWLFEAAPEDLDLKRELFAAAAIAAPQAVLATNTSTLSVTGIAAACERPQDVIGMHFFNPPGVMRLVEIVPGMLTRPDLPRAATDLARRLGREPVTTKDTPGFIVNRLARPFYLEALRLHASGIPVAQIDTIMRSAGFRLGPFELLDLIGLDVNLAASLGVYRAFFEEPRYRPHPLQQAMVTAGLLGRKTGRGFYRYDEHGAKLLGDGAREPGGDTHDRGHSGERSNPLAILGDTSAARWLRASFAAGAVHGDPEGSGQDGGNPAGRSHGGGSDADLVLDARLKPPVDEVSTLLAKGATVAVLAWGRSASAASGSLGQGVPRGSLLGFSVLPGLPGARPRLELMAPLPASPSERPAGALALERAGASLAAAGADVEVIADTAGGVAFRIVALLANEAIGALADGLANRGEMDLAMRLGLNYPLGPLEWAERIGLSALHEALLGLHAETHDAKFAPHPYLTQLVAVGAQTLASRTAARTGP
ncbi:MAG TPA: 3-hydroxyacyl-CoA dehydrogenase NAD-binding domain-containing protein [Trueperaceae bacterium]|nr:3-hydroxyacyl-CoA dehydrogenase NAD-binding domain-containing protein [Trueperaceae bacterium]